MVRALLICSLYNIASFRRLCSAISENLAYRWFCFLTIDDPVFDHSSISHFIDRIGRDGFAAIFDGLNDELLQAGDAVAGDVRGCQSGQGQRERLRPGAQQHDGGGVQGTQAVEENGLFVLTETTVDGDGVEHGEVRYFQSPEGQDAAEPSGHRRPLEAPPERARRRGCSTRRTSSWTWVGSSCPEG